MRSIVIDSHTGLPKGTVTQLCTGYGLLSRAHDGLALQLPRREKEVTKVPIDGPGASRTRLSLALGTEIGARDVEGRGTLAASEGEEGGRGGEAIAGTDQ